MSGTLKISARRSDRDSVDRLGALYRNLGNSLELEEILSTLHRELQPLMAYDALAVLLVDDAALTPAYAAGDEFRDVAKLQTGIVGEEAARAVRENRAVTAGPIRIFPLEHDREVNAVLLLHGGGDLDLLESLAPRLAASIANARRYQRVEQLAEADPLTGLANVRSLFQRLDAEIARARRCQTTLAVFECSVEGFDRSGLLCSPSVTRNVFQRVAHKLRESCREYDFAARSGDAIVVLLPGFPPENLVEKREQIHRIVEESGVGAGLPLYAKVGAAFFPDDGEDAEDLLAVAARRAHHGSRG
jgi:diguanylate cyclase (GGDEF)-like protein